jgi:ABC-type transporter Mla subunit MlaD
MAEPGRIDPFADVISLIAGPIAAVIRSFDQLRKGADELMRGLENFNKTMTNLNDTAERVNRLLNDFEEPVRAMLPQITRTVKLADEMSARLAQPIDQVVPGLARLAETLNSPVMRELPVDLGQFLEVINELTRRMAPLGQLAEQAGGLFGLRLPGFPPRPTPRPAEPVPAQPALAPAEPEPEPAPVKKAPARKRATKRATAKKSTAKKSAAKKAAARKAAARKAPAKRTAATKTSAKQTAPMTP